MSIVVACPECEKKIRVADDALGKKIRCPACEAVFATRAPSPAPKPARPASVGDALSAVQKKPARPPVDEDAPIKLADDNAVRKFGTDDDDNADPYGVTVEDLTVRCPHCAKEMETPESVVCLHCGYNTRTRKRPEQKVVYDPTAGDYFLHLLPGILAVLGVIALGTLVFILYRKLPYWLDGTFLGTIKEGWFLPPNALVLWVAVPSGIVSWKFGKFAYRRLFVNNKPTEIEIK